MNPLCRCGASGGHERPGKGGDRCKERLPTTTVSDAANSVFHYTAVFPRQERTG